VLTRVISHGVGRAGSYSLLPEKEAVHLTSP
jgi:hypothetical protein